MKISEKNKDLARQLAKLAYEYDRAGDIALRNQAIRNLVEIIGFYLDRKRFTVSEFRGDAVAVAYITPAGGWTSNKLSAIEKWATTAAG